MNNKSSQGYKIIAAGLILLLAVSMVRILLIGSNIPAEGVKKTALQSSAEDLDLIFAGVIENNRRKLEKIEDYGDEFCYRYVSTSEDVNVHREILDHLQNLSDEICADSETDYEKVKAIAYWVSENVYYNHSAAETHVDSDTISLETTLKTKTTTCAGYANMFSALCNMQGIYCINLRGGSYAQENTAEYLLNAPMSHEWNAARVDGEWVFVDTTWISNNIYTEEGFQKGESFDDQFFDMSLEYMSYRHRIDLNDHRDFKSSINALENKTSGAESEADSNETEAESVNEDSEWAGAYSYLTTLRDYIEENEDPLIASYDYGKNITVIYLLDFDSNDIEDALISKFNGNGMSYYLIRNIDDPQIVYDFGAFDEIELFYDPEVQQNVIKYFSSWGLMTYATSETNYIYIGDEISEIKHVHFSGTSGPEEFYIEVNDEKTVCDEGFLNESINNIEKGLQELTDIKKFRMTLFEDGSEAIIEPLN